MDYNIMLHCIEAIDRKRIPPHLKGWVLHDFKNEYNTLKQVLHWFKDLENPVDRRLALHWAVWGATHLKDYFGVSEEEKSKMDTKQLNNL